MFKGLKYYEELSEELAKEIEICKESYENFEKSKYLTTPKEERTKEQNDVAQEFYRFCNDEGFRKVGERIKYKDIRQAIEDRIKFLEEQKQINDEMLALHTELDTLKNGILTDETVEQLKNEAEKHYSPEENKKEYTDYLEKLKNRAIEKQIDSVNNDISTTKNKISTSKKENGLVQVMSSAFGPIGNKIYNAYAWSHNKNVDLRKNRVLNLVIKAGVCLGYTALCASLFSIGTLTGFPLVAAGAIAVYSFGKTVVNTFKKVPDKLSFKDKISNLKESWFRYRKSRGKGSLSVNEKLYNGIDFSKYNTPDAGEREEDSLEHDHEREDELEHELPVGTPEIPVETPEDVPVGTPEDVPVETPEDVPVGTPEDVPVETPEDVPVETPEDVPVETSEVPVRTPLRNPETSKFERSISSLDDIIAVARKLESQGGLKNLDDWSKFKECNLYLYHSILRTNDSEKKQLLLELHNVFGKLLLDTEGLDLANRIDNSEPFEMKKIYEGRESASTDEMLASNINRDEEYNKLVELLNNADLDTNVMKDVNDFFSHYRFPSEEENFKKQRYISELLADREEQRNNGRKK